MDGDDIVLHISVSAFDNNRVLARLNFGRYVDQIIPVDLSER